MTIQSTVQVRCGHCGKSYEAEIYSAIDVSSDPELKEKVRDGSVFLLECPHCGTKALGKGEMLYIDPEAKQFFSFNALRNASSTSCFFSEGTIPQYRGSASQACVITIASLCS